MVTRPTRSRFAWQHPLSYLGIHGVVGLVLSVACAWLFFAIAEDIPEKGTLVRTDLAVTAWLQTHGSERGESIFVGVSYLGAQVLIAILLALAIVFVVRRDWRRLSILAVTAGGGALLNAALKSVFQRSRPEFAAEFKVSSWSFPSGHAMNSLIAYGLLAYWVAAWFPRRRRWIYLVGGVLVAAIGYARIYLGVHYLSDVLAGYTAGLMWLTVCISGYRFAERRALPQRLRPAHSETRERAPDGTQPVVSRTE